MEISKALEEWGAQQGAAVDWRGGRQIFEWTLARRGTGGRQSNLRYRIELEATDADQTVTLHETLWERAVGPTVDLAPSLHMREETFRLGTVWEKTAWEVHAHLLRRTYDCTFDFANLRHRLEQLCKRNGYRLRQLIPV